MSISVKLTHDKLKHLQQLSDGRPLATSTLQFVTLTFDDQLNGYVVDHTGNSNLAIAILFGSQKVNYTKCRYCWTELRGFVDWKDNVEIAKRVRWNGDKFTS